MPSCAIERDDGVGAGRDVCADFSKMQVHGFGTDDRQHQCSANAARRTNSAKYVGPVIALIAGRARPAAFVSPDVGQTALLANAGFILPPQLYGLIARVLWDSCSNQLGKVFLCASWVAGSCAG